MAAKAKVKEVKAAKAKAPEARLRYTVRVGSALLGQPQVRCEIPEQGVGHTFFRRKRGEDGVFVTVPDEAWEATLTPTQARKLQEVEFDVTEVKHTKAAGAAKE